MKKEVRRLILILFLISVAVMEIIVSKDQSRERRKPPGGPETMTRDLLALAGAAPPRVPPQGDGNPQNQHVPASPREHASIIE